MAQPERELRQGDWLETLPPLHVITAEGEPGQIHDAPHGAVVMTQCCDLAQNHSGITHVLPVVKLDANTAAQVRRGSTSRYAPLIDDYYADLAMAFPVCRQACDTSALRHRMTEPQRQTFAARISRRFTRFAYPEALYPILEPFKRAIRSKALKDNPAAKVLQQIDTLRLECEPDWNATEGLNLTLLVVVDNDHLPTSPELPTRPPEDTFLSHFIQHRERVSVLPIGSIGSSPGSIHLDLQPSDFPPPTLMDAAAAILASSPNDPERATLWDRFGRALEALLNAGAENTHPDLIAGIEVEVLRADELSYSRYQASVDLDLDDLSPPITEH